MFGMCGNGLLSSGVALSDVRHFFGKKLRVAEKNGGANPFSGYAPRLLSFFRTI